MTHIRYGLDLIGLPAKESGGIIPILFDDLNGAIDSAKGLQERHSGVIAVVTYLADTDGRRFVRDTCPPVAFINDGIAYVRSDGRLSIPANAQDEVSQSVVPLPIGTEAFSLQVACETLDFNHVVLAQHRRPPVGISSILDSEGHPIAFRVHENEVVTSTHHCHVLRITLDRPTPRAAFAHLQALA